MKKLHELLPSNTFVLTPGMVREIAHELQLGLHELMKALVTVAQVSARPPISEYKVGAVALGKSGAIYLGVNLEFPGTPLNSTIHAEQFAIVSARNHGETGILAIAVSAAPCGHCRQFMNEMGGDPTIMIPNTKNQSLSAFLPMAFGPNDLGLTGNLLSPTTSVDPALKLSLVGCAKQAADTSYVPYTKAHAGVAIQTEDGKVYSGCALENAAYNPSVSPLQAALIALVADGKPYHEIKHVVLVEHDPLKIGHALIAREILKHIAPYASFTVTSKKFAEENIQKPLPQKISSRL